MFYWGQIAQGRRLDGWSPKRVTSRNAGSPFTWSKTDQCSGILLSHLPPFSSFSVSLSCFLFLFFFLFLLKGDEGGGIRRINARFECTFAYSLMWHSRPIRM